MEEIICENCDGDGEVIDYNKVRSHSIDPPLMECPDCEGSGVTDDTD